MSFRARSFAVLALAAGLAYPRALVSQVAGASEVPVVTLSEARRRASSVDPDAVAARADVTTAFWERRTARTNLYTPTITAGANYTRLKDPFINFGTFENSKTSTNATLEGSYSIFGSRKFAELKRTKATLESAEADETAEQFRTALSTDEIYFAVLADRELSRVAADRLQRAQEQFGIARVRVLAGDALSTDSLQLLLEVTRARLDVLRRDSARVVSQLRLGRQIGLSGPADAAPIDSAAPRALPLTIADAVTELRDRGPELLAARAAERSADANVTAERGGYLPDITLGALTGAYDTQFFPSAVSRSQIALTVSVPIWDGGQRELAIVRARGERDVARAEREEQERAATEMIAEAYHGYETSRAAIELAQIGVAVASESFRVQRARYREGAAPILEILEAQGALSDAEATLVQARYATRLALARIEAVLGRRIFESDPGR
jgi:outer membrane protein TolC